MHATTSDFLRVSGASLAYHTSEAAPIKCAGSESAGRLTDSLIESAGRPTDSLIESVGKPADSLPAHFIGAASGAVFPTRLDSFITGEIDYR